MPNSARPSLLCRVAELLCALPLEHVEETMRPLVVESIAGAPDFVQGLAIVRGTPVPVVDAATLLTGGASHPTRFVTVKTGSRRVALAVDAVVGIRAIPGGSLDALPPLFQDAHLESISAIGRLDAELMIVLRSARLIPEGTWALIEAAGASA